MKRINEVMERAIEDGLCKIEKMNSRIRENNLDALEYFVKGVPGSKQARIGYVLILMKEFEACADAIKNDVLQGKPCFSRGNKNTARLKRISMEITRALTEYRKG